MQSMTLEHQGLLQTEPTHASTFKAPIGMWHTSRSCAPPIPPTKVNLMPSRKSIGWKSTFPPEGGVAREVAESVIVDK